MKWTKNKPQWIFQCGMYRTASTAHYRMARDIVKKTGNGAGIGYHTETRLEELDRMPKKGHMVVCKVFKFLPQHSPFGKKFLKQGRLKALCTIRDPRDIIVSMKERSNARLPNGKRAAKFDFRDTVVDNFPIWLGQLDQWIALGPDICMVTKYEDFILNLFREAKRIAEHLGIEIKPALLKRIAKDQTIQAQIEAKREYRASKEEGKREDPHLPSVPAIKFGTSGHWRTWLSTAEVKLVEEICGDFMRRYGYL